MWLLFEGGDYSRAVPFKEIWYVVINPRTQGAKVQFGLGKGKKIKPQ